MEKGFSPGLGELAAPFCGAQRVEAASSGGSLRGALCPLGSLGATHGAAGVQMCSLPVSLALSCGVFQGRVCSLKWQPCAWPSGTHSPAWCHR